MEILIIFFSILFFSISTYGHGKLFQILIGKSHYKMSIGEIGFLGFIFISLITLFIHFFLPLNQFLNTIIYIIGIIFFITEYFVFKNRNIFHLKRKDIFFIIIILFVSFFMFIKYHPNEDFGYYHLPYIINLNEEKIIFGLSNLQLNQGWNSIWLNLKSTYNIKYLSTNGVFFSDVVFYIFISLIFYQIIFKNIYKKKSIFVFFFSLFFLIFLNLKFSRLNSYGLDVPSNFLLVYIFILFFSCLDSKIIYKNKFYIFEFLILFCAFSSMFRIINIISFILPFIILIKFKFSLKQILNSRIILLSLIFFSLFQIQQVIYTGCFLFPNIFTCLENLSWYDLNIIENFNTDTSKVNKSYQTYEGILTREEYLKNFNWVSNWIIRNKIEIIEHVVTFILPLFIYILFLKFKNINKKKFIFKNINLYILLFLIFSLIIWFIKAPVIRFGTIYIQSTILIIFLMFFKRKIKILPSKSLIIFLLIFALSGNLLRNFDRLVDAKSYDQFIPIIPKINYKSEKLQNIKLNTPVKNSKIPKSELCWNVPSLCKINSFEGLEIKRIKSYIYIYKN